MVETERFEALFDAILAIIITMIVLEIPLASIGSWEALFDLKYEFLIYAVSFIVCFNFWNPFQAIHSLIKFQCFIVCFNFWNYNNNIFHLVNKIDYKVIWTMAITLFVFSFLPYLTSFVGENFYLFLPQLLYGLGFIITAILSMIIGNFLKQADPGNIALHIALSKHYPMYTTIITVSIGMIIGYFIYPPAIIACCLLSILGVWSIPRIIFHMK